MKINHNYFLNLAFNLAEINLGKTQTNPSVGCLVVKDNSVLSSGVTSEKGRPHAEFNAFRKKINFKNSSMYLTLEPCTHYGLTPPCTKIIKNKKIKNVYYCFHDPDTRTYKKAREILIKDKINTKKISQRKNNFYKGYFLNKKKNLPLVDAKIALSRDFFSIDKRSKWITNSRSRLVGHLIRSRYDAIISTSKSINKDNSQLNCRIKGLDNNKPELFIIDRNLHLKKNLKIFKILNKRKTFIITSSNNQKKINFFKQKKFKIIKIKSLKSKDDFILLFKKIFNLGKSRILIETGMIFLNELLRYNLISDLFLFMSTKKLGRNGYNNTNINSLKKYNFKKKENVNLEGECLYKVKVK